MEDNKNLSPNGSDIQKSTTPYLSKRGQYNPNLKQVQQQPFYGNANSASQPGTYQTEYTQQHTYGYDEAVYEQQKLKHSGLGIASFIISISAIIISVISFVLVLVSIGQLMTNSNIDMNTFSDSEAVSNLILSGDMGASTTSLVIGSLLLFLSMGISFIGGILGLISVFIKNRKKVFGILGLIFNALIFFGFIFFFILGLVSGL